MTIRTECIQPERTIPGMARLIRMDDTGHTTLAEWTAADEPAVEAAVTAFREQLDAGVYAGVAGGARPLAPAPPVRGRGDPGVPPGAGAVLRAPAGRRALAGPPRARVDAHD